MAAKNKLSASVVYAAPPHCAPPPRAKVRRWLAMALPAGGDVGVRFVDEAESAALNKRWRRKNKAAEVLSFPYEKNGGVVEGDVDRFAAVRPVGDIVVCAPLAEKMAQAAGEEAARGYARLLFHGALHLRGHTHRANLDWREMRQVEAKLLSRLHLSGKRPNKK